MQNDTLASTVDKKQEQQTEKQENQQEEQKEEEKHNENKQSSSTLTLSDQNYTVNCHLEDKKDGNNKTENKKTLVIDITKNKENKENIFNYLFKLYISLLKKYPLITKIITSSFISFIATIVSQKFIKKLKFLQWNNIVNFSVTSGISSIFSHYWYNYLDLKMNQLKEFNNKLNTLQNKNIIFKFLDILLNNKNLKNLPIISTSLDQLIFAPFINIIFISILSILEKRNVVKSLQKDFWVTLKRGWILWPIATFIILGIIPVELQVLFFNFVGFFWSLYLSYAL
ncbi:hypothetical protein ABK040_006195 [Willaertia magna]